MSSSRLYFNSKLLFQGDRYIVLGKIVAFFFDSESWELLDMSRGWTTCEVQRTGFQIKGKWSAKVESDILELSRKIAKDHFFLEGEINLLINGKWKIEKGEVLSCP